MNKITSFAEIGGKDDNPNEKTHTYPGGVFKVNPEGVFHIGFDKEGNELAPLWICSPVHILAQTRDTGGCEWGRLLRWHDKDGRQHEWAMPSELLQGDGMEIRKELARQGVDIAAGQKARNLLSSYFQSWPVDNRARCTQRMGWYNSAYVTPSEVIGSGEEKVVFQNISHIEPGFEDSGTVDHWRENVAQLAAGNSRVVFAISAAFAAPLAGIINAEGGGFHFRGGSSTGKTTALIVACSVWGGLQFRRAWKATGNGLEGLAAFHNDNLLVLDEISEINPSEAGAAAYMLANGQGKTRANKNGDARPAAKWRLIFLSAGEESLTALMNQAGKRSNAGQELRLADVEADAGAGMGIFENIHGEEKPGNFALKIKEQAEKFHGAVGIAFLRQAVQYKSQVAETLTDGIRQFVSELQLPAEAAQAGRVARRFALVAAAGELATLCGLTGWQEGEAEQSAKKCFNAWLCGFGGLQNREETKTMQQVKAFFEAHESSRFEPFNNTDEQRIINRVGFYRCNDGKKEYLVLPEAFKNEVCKGLDHKTAIKILVKLGWLEPSKDKAAQLIRFHGEVKPKRVYVFNGSFWGAEP